MQRGCPGLLPQSEGLQKARKVQRSLPVLAGDSTALGGALWMLTTWPILIESTFRALPKERHCDPRLTLIVQ